MPATDRYDSPVATPDPDAPSVAKRAAARFWVYLMTGLFVLVTPPAVAAAGWLAAQTYVTASGCVLSVFGLVAAFVLFWLAGEQAMKARQNSPGAAFTGLFGQQVLEHAARATDSAHALRRWQPAVIALGVAVGAAVAGIFVFAAVQAGESGGAYAVIVASAIACSGLALGFMLAVVPVSWLQRRVAARVLRAKLADFAAGRGWVFQPELVEGQLAEYGGLPLFRHGRKHRGRGYNFLAGDVAGRAVRVLTFSFAESGGRIQGKDFQRRTVALAAAALPAFRVWPHGRLDAYPPLGGRAVAAVLEAVDITYDPSRAGLEPGQDYRGAPGLTGHGLFARAEDVDALKEIISPAVIAFLASRTDLVIESADGWLGVYRWAEDNRDTSWPPEDYPARLDEASALFGLLTAVPPPV
jgi:hypothetical protein